MLIRFTDFVLNRPIILGNVITRRYFRYSSLSCVNCWGSIVGSTIGAIVGAIHELPLRVGEYCYYSVHVTWHYHIDRYEVRFRLGIIVILKMD